MVYPNCSKSVLTKGLVNHQDVVYNKLIFYKDLCQCCSHHKTQRCTGFPELPTMKSSMRISVRKTNVVASALVAIIVSHDHATSGQHRCQLKKKQSVFDCKDIQQRCCRFKKSENKNKLCVCPNFFGGHGPNSITFVAQHPLSQMFGHFQWSSEIAVFPILSERHEIRHSEYFITGALDKKCYCLQIIRT